MNTSNNSHRGGQGNNGSRIFEIDVEAAGPAPTNGVMTEFGVVDVTTRQWFHGRLWDATPDPDIPAKPVPQKENPGWTVGHSQFDLQDGMYRSAKDAKQVYVELEKWLKALAGGARIVGSSDNNGYDMMWMQCGFASHGMTSPLGFSSRRIGDYAAGLLNDSKNTSKWKQLRDVKHDHTAHADAQGNAGARRALVEMERRLNALYPDYKADADRIFKELRAEASKNKH